MTPERLNAFEREVAALFEAGAIPGPVHLSGGNENQLVDIFSSVHRDDWVFSTWRSHYHALLKGVPEELVMEQIREGRSMNMMFPEYNFFTSAIVGGIIPIATGVAASLVGTDRKVMCFIGDMTACCGVYYEARLYADRHFLPIEFIVERNGYSCNTPVPENRFLYPEKQYSYQRTWPHVGTGKWVTF